MTDQDRPPNGMEKLNEHGVFVASALAFDWMGLSVRDPEWRFTLWLEWDGAALAPLWEREVGVGVVSRLWLAAPGYCSGAPPSPRAPLLSMI